MAPVELPCVSNNNAGIAHCSSTNIFPLFCACDPTAHDLTRSCGIIIWIDFCCWNPHDNVLTCLPRSANLAEDGPTVSGVSWAVVILPFGASSMS